MSLTKQIRRVLTAWFPDMPTPKREQLVLEIDSTLASQIEKDVLAKALETMQEAPERMRLAEEQRDQMHQRLTKLAQEQTAVLAENQRLRKIEADYGRVTEQVSLLRAELDRMRAQVGKYSD